MPLISDVARSYRSWTFCGHGKKYTVKEVPVLNHRILNNIELFLSNSCESLISTVVRIWLLNNRSTDPDPAGLLITDQSDSDPDPQHCCCYQNRVHACILVVCFSVLLMSDYV
jgi:hypothetical protein